MPNNSSASDLNIRLFQGLSRIPQDWQLCLSRRQESPSRHGLAAKTAQSRPNERSCNSLAKR